MRQSSMDLTAVYNRYFYQFPDNSRAVEASDFSNDSLEHHKLLRNLTLDSADGFLTVGVQQFILRLLPWCVTFCLILLLLAECCLRWRQRLDFRVFAAGQERCERRVRQAITKYLPRCCSRRPREPPQEGPGWPNE